MKSICVFCGSSSGNDPIYRAAAQELGAAIAKRGMSLIYGGASVGLMGAVADAALAAGGEVIGIIPDKILELEVEHQSLTKMIKVKTMSERKDLMVAKSDAFINLPGGYGTLDEAFEVMTGNQIGAHTKPSGFLNVAGYYDPLIKMVDHMVSEGFVAQKYRDMFYVDGSVESLLASLDNHEPTLITKSF